MGRKWYSPQQGGSETMWGNPYNEVGKRPAKNSQGKRHHTRQLNNGTKTTNHLQ
jgi:hypothetical protein